MYLPEATELTDSEFLHLVVYNSSRNVTATILDPVVDRQRCHIAAIQAPVACAGEIDAMGQSTVDPELGVDQGYDGLLLGRGDYDRNVFKPTMMTMVLIAHWIAWEEIRPEVISESQYLQEMVHRRRTDVSQPALVLLPNTN